MEEDNEKELKWPNKLYMLRENEMWLNEQAKKGLFLKHFDNGYAYFTENNLESRKYKIIIMNKKKAENQIKIIENQGFTFVASYKKYFIFCINGEYGHIKLKLTEDMIKFTRRWFNKQIIEAFSIIIIFIFPIIEIIFLYKMLFQVIVEMDLKWYVFWGAIFSSCIVYGISESRPIIMSKRYFLEHEKYLKKSPTTKPKIEKLVAVILYIFAFFMMICFNNENDKVPISVVYNDMPFVLLQNTETQGDLEGEFNESLRNIDKYNYAKIKHTLMAPKQYYAVQKKSGDYMIIWYYEVAVGVLAEPLARELPTNDLAYIEKEKLQKIDYEGLDAVYLNKEGDITVVSACKGKKIMCILFDRDLPVEKFLSEMVEVL